MNRRDMLNALMLTSASSVSLPVGCAVALDLLQHADVDNTPALQKAIDALQQAGGGTLFIPAGNYRVRELRLKSHVKLVGLGKVVLTLFNPDRDGYIARIVGHSDIGLESLRFDCSIEAGRENTVGCLEATTAGSNDCTNLQISECEFANAQNNAWIIFRGVKRASVHNCRFLDHLRETEGATHGLSIAEDSSAIRIVDCLFDNPAGYHSVFPSKGHIGIDRATDVWIERCIIQRATLNGITIEDSEERLLQNVTIRDCVIRDCKNAGLQVEGNGLVNLSILNCDFVGNGNYGARLVGGQILNVQMESCNFTNNSLPKLDEGNSQLLINMKPSQIALIRSCVFQTVSDSVGFVHIFYLNGAASVTGCSFLGGSSGYGIYTAPDPEKQLQRETAAFMDLRFNGVGTPTFRLPQFCGRTWQNRRAREGAIETLIRKDSALNKTETLVDIWIPTTNETSSGALFADISLLLNSKVGGGGACFQLTAKRDTNEAAVISPINRYSKSLDSAALQKGIDPVVTAAVVKEDRACRIRISTRVNTEDAKIVTNMSVTASIDVMWDGLSSAPVFV